MDLLDRIRQVLQAEKNEVQLDKFLTEIRDSLATTNRLFLSYQVAALISLVVYHLIVYGGGASFTFSGVQLSDLGLFRRVFLVIPAALLAASTGLGYLRKLQRETYDYLTISRYSILGKTGLHELRLPGDFILGLFLLKIEGGIFGRIASYAIVGLTALAFTVGPLAYMISEAIRNVQIFGTNDWLCVAASVATITLCICVFVVIRVTMRIKTEFMATTSASSSQQS